MRKKIMALSLAALGLSASLVTAIPYKSKTFAQTADNIQRVGINPPLNSSIYALSVDGTIYQLRSGSPGFTRLARPSGLNGNLIGIDGRPADNANNTRLYGLTDRGAIYTINVAGSNIGQATLVSTLNPNFQGGFQSLIDFNPVVNALRIMGTNDQNYAAVNSNGGNLNATAVQTKLAYAAGDVNQGKDPSICGGTYTNNLTNAKRTIFYAVDNVQNTFVTIAPPLSATGSSNTGGGQLQTIGRLVNQNGQPINIGPLTDMDCYTDSNSVNTIFGISGLTFFQIDLGQINPNLPLGRTQNVVVKGVTLTAPGAVAFMDIAVPIARPAGQ